MLIYERVAVPCPVVPASPALASATPAEASPGGGLQTLSLASPNKGGGVSLPYDMAPVLFYVRRGDACMCCGGVDAMASEGMCEAILDWLVIFDWWQVLPRVDVCLMTTGLHLTRAHFFTPLTPWFADGHGQQHQQCGAAASVASRLL